MRINNKYIRNHLFKTKARKHIVKKEGEFSHKSFFPYSIYGISHYGHDEQLKEHQEYINTLLILKLSGSDPGYFNAPKWFKKCEERSRRRQVNASVRQMVYDDEIEIPKFKRDINWDWF